MPLRWRAQWANRRLDGTWSGPKATHGGPAQSGIDRLYMAPRGRIFNLPCRLLSIRREAKSTAEATHVTPDRRMGTGRCGGCTPVQSTHAP
jgi:hypothetical protein